jgi:ribosomal protein S26
MDGIEISKMNEWYERQKMCKNNCDAPLFTDLGIVKCQNCMKPVTKERAVKYLLFNNYSHTEIENLLSHNKNKDL